MPYLWLYSQSDHALHAGAPPPIHFTPTLSTSSHRATPHRALSPPPSTHCSTAENALHHTCALRSSTADNPERIASDASALVRDHTYGKAKLLHSCEAQINFERYPSRLLASTKHMSTPAENNNEARESRIEAQVRDLRNVFDPSIADISTDVSYLLRKLHDLHQREPRVRFHLLMDQDVNPGNTTVLASQLRILHSPTLCISDPRQQQLVQTIAGLMGLLNGLSNAHVSQQNVPQNVPQPEPAAQQTEDTTQQTLPSPLALISNFPQNERDDLRLFQPRTIPSWYPGSKNTVQLNDIIELSAETVSLFQLEDKKVRWLYAFFFRQASYTTSKHSRQPQRFKGIYRQFTPPWYVGDFVVANRIFATKVSCVENVKSFRSNEGARMLIWTLAAYYEHEPAFSQQPLDYMLKHIDELMRLFPNASKMTEQDNQQAPNPGVSQHQIAAAPTVPSAEEESQQHALSFVQTPVQPSTSPQPSSDIEMPEAHGNPVLDSLRS